jgi:CubicO group peptidase (beta-lactamase class C family)
MFHITGFHFFYKKLMNRLWILIVLFLASGQPVSSQASQLQREIEKIIRYETFIDFGIVPGLLVGVIDGDSTYVCSFGQTMDKDSIYEIGSITKPIVAWLVDGLTDSLGLNSESSICQFLPDSLCFDHLKPVTIQQLINHRSGLPKFPSDIGASEESILDPYATYDRNQLALDMLKLSPVPGQYSYSHIGYSFLYWLFERAGGLESYANRKLFSVIGMDHTGWNIPDSLIAKGHGLHGKFQPPWHVNAFSPAMGLKSSLSDLLIFIRSVSEDLSIHEPSLTPAFKKELKVLDKAGEYKVIQGWFVVDAGSYLTYFHTGRTGGHQVSIAFSPHSKKGVIIISNGSAGSNNLSLLILDMVMRAKN